MDRWDHVAVVHQELGIGPQRLVHYGGDGQENVIAAGDKVTRGQIVASLNQ